MQRKLLERLPVGEQGFAGFGGNEDLVIKEGHLVKLRLSDQA
jgi:hypothetical protein